MKFGFLAPPGYDPAPMFRWLASIFLAGLVVAGCAPQPTVIRGDAAVPDSAAARRLNGQAYELISRGDYTRAEPLLQQAMAADVMFGPARNNLGLVYFHQNKLYPSAWEFQNAIKLMPFVAEPRYNLGMVFEKAGKLAEAAEQYQSARKFEPDNPQILGNLARVNIRRGLRDEETRRLLEELAIKDSRPEWNDWARLELLRWSGRGSATRPSP